MIKAIVELFRFQELPKKIQNHINTNTERDYYYLNESYQQVKRYLLNMGVEIYSDESGVYLVSGAEKYVYDKEKAEQLNWDFCITKDIKETICKVSSTYSQELEYLESEEYIKDLEFWYTEDGERISEFKEID